jgi:hypothetical protein
MNAGHETQEDSHVSDQAAFIVELMQSRNQAPAAPVVAAVDVQKDVDTRDRERRPPKAPFANVCT